MTLGEQVDHEAAGAEDQHITTDSEPQAELVEAISLALTLQTDLDVLTEEHEQLKITCDNLREQLAQAEDDNNAASEYIDRIRMVLDDYNHRER